MNPLNHGLAIQRMKVEGYRVLMMALEMPERAFTEPAIVTLGVGERAFRFQARPSPQRTLLIYANTRFDADLIQAAVDEIKQGWEAKFLIEASGSPNLLRFSLAGAAKALPKLDECAVREGLTERIGRP